MTKLISAQTISYDKINQLRHVKYLKNKEHTLEIMKRHASVMAPKFEVVAKWLAQEITETTCETQPSQHNQKHNHNKHKNGHH